MTDTTQEHAESRATPPRTLNIPALSLVVMVGASGCGKSTFARRHFRPTEVLSSDFFRGMVADDETEQSATTDAFETLHFVARKRLRAARLTVVDATNTQSAARKPLVALARETHVIPVAIVLNVPERVCQARNRERTDRQVPPHAITSQTQQLRKSIRDLRREGFRHVFVLDEAQADAVESIVREPLWNDRRHEHGPFDVVGDVHGCGDELDALLDALGYVPGDDGVRRHPDGRKAVFVGDLVDRGPRIVHVLRTVMAMVQAGSALAVPGNHDVKLVRALRGRDVRITHGLDRSLAELEGEAPDFRTAVAEFLDKLVSHYVLDGGALVVAHAGLREELQGRGSGAVREFALYGETTGETDEFGLPVRHNWAAEYRGRATVVYGHTPVPGPEWLNRTINVDTGCVFGGRLTALRWPERELVSVPAAHTYAEPARPFLPAEAAAPALTAQQRQDELLDLDDVTGKRIVQTRLAGRVTIREENAAAALEVMSRFAANPRWLVYLPPTMSPSATTAEPGLLEHPAEAFAYYRNEGIPAVVCEEKHMGSRAVVVVCRDEEAARRRFGVVDEGIGIVYTRTGRGFFDDGAIEARALGILRDAMTAAGFWDELRTDWAVLDCELMPWSAKAQELIRGQYAAVGAAARGALGEVADVLGQAAARGAPVDGLREKFAGRQALAADYVQAYGRYCWPVESVDDLRLAPFHVLATEGALHADRDHLWHMDVIGRVRAASDRLLYATGHHVVDVTDPDSQARAIAWWEEMTGAGGEGMVVKPLQFTARGRRGVVQPAVKCRGREYLRIIYGPEYTLPQNLERLRSRGLGAKRSLAMREFALGIEGLERFVRGEPLRRVHECVFGVLALESEPVDPRL
ncbi:MAG TPA: polynucleotide kinase-phosphatase [Longimicrobium sp.]|jgi:polynucleotide kinase-phosphatase|uniref:polynucleotide kinase-phosphatase n=1 Tax=Longimicrobium sp. TaxID=2029185 RepID=UPI002ED9C4F0